MSKLSIRNVDNLRVTNKVVVVFLLALVSFVSFVPIFVPSSQASTVSLKLLPIRGMLASLVTASGHGYAPASTVTVTFGSPPIIVGTQVVNSTGGFSLSFLVPQVKAGVYTVIASDGTGNSKSAPFTVVSKARISLHPISGLAGTSVTISGMHFAYNSALTIKFNGKNIATSISSSTGTISVPIIVPSNKVGIYSILVTDALGYAASAAFTIT